MIWVGLDFWAGASSAYSFFGALLALCIGSPCAPSGRCLLFGSAAAAVAAVARGHTHGCTAAMRVLLACRRGRALTPS